MSEGGIRQVVSGAVFFVLSPKGTLLKAGE